MSLKAMPHHCLSMGEKNKTLVTQLLSNFPRISPLLKNNQQPIHTMKKVFIVCVALLAFSSCTRIKNKVIHWLCPKEVTECNIGTLYPELDGKDCIGVRAEDCFFYRYCFRYKATPDEVEKALMAKECSYVEIVPDTAFYRCDRGYMLDKMYKLSQENYPEYDEWRWCDHPDSLLFYACMRTPLQHLLVFDKVTGYVYHCIYEFAE